MQKRKRTPQDEDDRIENYKEVMHALGRHKFMKPDGSYVWPEVDNPQLDNKAPKYLRVRLPREGMNFKVIEDAHELGLEVGDVFQLTYDHAHERVAIRLDPRGE